VLEEQKQVLGKSKGVGYEQVKQMNYLEAAIRESLRVSGAILGPTRMAMQDIQAGEFNIPKGTLVSLSMNFTHHLKELWGDDVDKFRPERFLGQDTQPPYAFIPFGSGALALPHLYWNLLPSPPFLSMCFLVAEHRPARMPRTLFCHPRDYHHHSAIPSFL